MSVIWRNVPNFPKTIAFYGCNPWGEISSCSRDTHDLIVITKNVLMNHNKYEKRYDVFVSCKIHYSEDKRANLNYLYGVNSQDNVMTMTLQELEVFLIQNS